MTPHTVYIMIALLLLCVVWLAGATVYIGPLPTLEDTIILGALFPVHKNMENQCGDVLDLGLQRLEAMVLAVDKINNNSALLPGITLTFEIRDTCTQSNYALEQSLHFVSSRGVLGISGVVGAASSSVSIAVASLLRLFKIPQISYASTAVTLSDRTRFDYFFRTIPPDSLQTQVMADLIDHFNWSYVYALHSDDVYGTVGIQALLKALEGRNCSETCVATQISVPVVATSADLDEVLLEMSRSWVNNASVAVLFGQLATAVKVLEAVDRSRGNGPLKNITWIASDAWGDQIPSHLYPVGHGMLAVLPLAKHSQVFDDYFTGLTPLNNAGNPWFREYWENVFNCSFQSVAGLRACDVNERISVDNGYRQNSKVPFAIDAVYAFAHAMTNMQRALCPSSRGLCPEMIDPRTNAVNGELLQTYLHNVSFSPGASAQEISFDASGDEQGSFLIKNLQLDGDGGHVFREVGVWMASNAMLSLHSEVEWIDGEMPESVCSVKCGGGQYPERVDDQAACCWICKRCVGDRHVSTGDKCSECEQGYAPNINLTHCDLTPLTFLTWSHVWSIIIIIVSIVGIALTVAVIVIFVVFYKHQIVKGSSRELSAFLLTGLLLCYLLPFAYIIRPSAIVCGIRRFGLGFCFTLCYSALLIKTNRIHRIFNRKPGSVSTPSLISPQSQVALTLLLIAVQVVIAVVWLVVEPPSILLVYNDFSTELKCGESPYIGISASFGYSLFLLLLSTYFAFRARKVPQNFNEAKFINLTLYTIVIIWLAFIPTYFATSQLGTIFQTSSLVLGIALSATTTLCCLFAPKIYFLFSKMKKEYQSSENERRPRHDSINSSGGVNLIHHTDKRKPSIYGDY